MRGQWRRSTVGILRLREYLASRGTHGAQDDKIIFYAQDDKLNVYARERYTPSAVSTLIFSPSLINGGTCTTSPVSVFAALVTLEAVALFNPGSVSITVNSTV